MDQWVEIDGLAFKVDSNGKKHRWLEYCVGCRRRTQIRIEDGRCGPSSLPGAIQGSSALTLSVQEVRLDNRVHYARCSVCGKLSPLPLEFR